MRISIKAQAGLKEFENFVVLESKEGENFSGRSLPERKRIAGIRELGDFTGEAGKSHLFYGSKSSRWLLVGLGNKAPFLPEDWRKAADQAQRAYSSLGIKKATLLLSEEADIFELVTGLILSGYSYDRFRSRKDHGKRLSTVTILMPASVNLKQANALRRKAEAHAKGTLLARDLLCAPGNLATPTYLAETANAIAEKSGGRIETRLKDRKALEEGGFTAHLAVARGSDEEPWLVEMDYNSEAEKTLVLVGKGLTFDSGGISLKPGAGMEDMKYDMGGAAAVLGVFEALAKLDLPLRIIGLVATCENMPSGRAYKPGDIVTSRSGKTIEVINTDAEGRVVLADALDYAKEFKPDFMIDLATLTGACVIALGGLTAGMLCNKKGEAFRDAMIESGGKTGERVWPLPMFEEYGEQIRSKVADVRNTGGRAAGTITAGKFLQTFADHSPWMHLDIAGVTWRDSDRAYIPKGGNGFGVRLLLDFIENAEL